MPVPPANFPRRMTLFGFGGAAVKFSARKTEDGKFSALVIDEEHQEAYENAIDLSTQLVGYALRKERENPSWTREFNLQRMRDGIESKAQSREWDFRPAEMEWIMTQLVKHPERSETTRQPTRRNAGIDALESSDVS